MKQTHKLIGGLGTKLARLLQKRERGKHIKKEQISLSES
jgi:hypothetical protein